MVDAAGRQPAPENVSPARIIVEGPGGVKEGEGPPGGGGPIRSTGSAPVTWNDLARIHDVDGLSEDDLEVLGEISEVLDRHGAKRRLGITLLHSHFDLADDEVLVETVDPDNRVMAIRSRPMADFDADELVPTAWRFVEDRLLPLQYCHRPKDSVFHQR